MLRWLIGLWYARLRGLDMLILWPECKRQAMRTNHAQFEPLDRAKAAFAYHAFHDRAWLILGEAEIIRQIDALT